MSSYTIPRVESVHHRLCDFARTALIKIFAHPYATVCDLYCGGRAELEKWDGAQISHYVGIASGVSNVRDEWETQKKRFTFDFFEADPCNIKLKKLWASAAFLKLDDRAIFQDSLEIQLQEKDIQADIVCCMQHLQICFETEEKARKLLNNVSFLLKPRGYFIGITPDSSTIWAKYQKNVEACHNRGSTLKSNTVPNCIRSESYMIMFEVEEEKFPLFGKKYQLKFASDISAETNCLVHFPSLIRLAREAGLEYIEIQNLTEFYDDNRVQFAGMVMNSAPNLVDPRGRLLPRSYDILSLYTTFIFQKPDPDITPPLTTPLLMDGGYIQDESAWQATAPRENDMISHVEVPQGLGKISEQKGILGPGPADLRFSEAL